MKRFLVIAILPFLVYACSIDVWEDDVRVETEESRSFSSYRMHKVEVKTKNGAIQSRVWDDESISIEFEKWATGDDREEAEDNLDDIRIHIDEDTTSGVLDIDVDIPHRIGTSYGCNVYLRLPSHLSLKFESSNGAITVRESQNDIECSTSNGAITIVDAEGDAELWTSNGAITVRNHHGELNAKTSNGAIDADVVLSKREDCILKTSNGVITLSIPDETSAMMEASTSNGKVEIEDLPITVIKMEKTGFKGKMGNGEGKIELETSNGNIFVRRSI
jgi:hypothetical protein